MDIPKVRDFWIEEADEALEVAHHLFEKKDYSYALFFGHLAIEKILKAVYVVRKCEHAPYSHNLKNLAELADIKLTEDEIAKLIKITEFSIKTRYPDQKRVFRKKCTTEFTAEELNQIGDIFKWFKSMIQT